ncbi:hypothetical protein ACS0TY_027863 [Phlomoides rotata]
MVARNRREGNHRCYLRNYGFEGQLPMTWFRSVDQLPMHEGENSDPLFPFGYGLRY